MRNAAIDHFRTSGRGTAQPASRDPAPRSSAAPVLDIADEAGDRASSAAVAAQRLGGRRAESVGRAMKANRGLRVVPGLVARVRGVTARIRPFKALAFSVFGVSLVGIVANAMVFQKGHHPAPLFGFGQPAALVETPDQRASATPAAVEQTGTLPPVPAVEPAPPVAAPAPPAPVRHVAPHRRDAKADAADAHPRPGHKPADTAKAKPDAKPGAKSDAADGKPHRSARHAKPEGTDKPEPKTRAETKPDPKPVLRAHVAAAPDKTATTPR